MKNTLTAHTRRPIQLHPRANISGLVLVRHPALVMRTELTNISVGGVLVCGLKPLTRNELLFVKEALKTGEKLHLTVQASRFSEVLDLCGHIIRIASKEETRGHVGVALVFSHIEELTKKKLFEGILEERTQELLNR